MPILLTTPYNPGDADPGVTYATVKILNFTIEIEHKKIYVNYRYGNINSSVWTTGIASPSRTFTIVGEDYTSSMASVIAEEDNDYLYSGVQRVLYNYMLTNNIVSGTIV